MINHFTLLGIMMSGYYSEIAAAGPSALLEKMRTSSIKAGPMLPLTKDKFELLTFGMEMDLAVNFVSCDIDQITYQVLYGDEAVYLEDPTGVDAVLLLDVGEYCFVSWRGTTTGMTLATVEDNLFRNLDVETRVAERLDGLGQCNVLEGMYEAYQGGELQEAELEPEVISFVKSCMSKPNKQLVLTGHSQGGGAAVVGAIRFAGYTPLTLAFAGVPAVKHPSSECTAINPEHLWRVINTELDPESHEILYDSVPYNNILPVAHFLLGEQIGASIHLAPDIPNPLNKEDPAHSPITYSQDEYGIAYFSKDQIALETTFGPIVGRLSGGNDVNWGAHSMILPKMYDMLEHGSFPLDVNGYVPGTSCLGDAECRFKCLNEVCASEDASLLPDGASCAAHDDCVSDSCSGCHLNLGGDWCCVGGDSNHGLTPNGGSCGQPSNCQSDRCTWNYTCEAKLENGASCGAIHMNDNDCASGECSYSWSDGWKCVASTRFIATGVGGGNIQI